MIRSVFLGMMAAYGIFCMIWACLGWLLGGKGVLLVCWGPPDEMVWRWSRWLRSWGLLHGPLVAVTAEPPREENMDGIEYCRPEELLSRLEQERMDTDGTGNGNSSGHHRRGGVPEL